MKIISSGQEGVELGALKGVELYNTKFKDSGVSTNGYALDSEDIRIKYNAKIYGLRESRPIPGFDEWKSCHIRNVDKSDVVIGILEDNGVYRESTKMLWYALHGEYRYFKISKEMPPPDEIKVINGGKTVIIIQRPSKDNIKEHAKSISQIISSVGAKRIMFLGCSKSTSSKIERLTSHLIFNILCCIYGKGV